ncbi:MAG: hypothetical protein L6R40_006284 [Gallowayella cf. fulva]|nr:MAG: hypothetical protein L6R40_006284 [Xanthomendoza cf. fulva]
MSPFSTSRLITIILSLGTLSLSTALPPPSPAPQLSPPTVPHSLLSPSTQPYKPLTINTPTGPLEGLQSIAIPNFFIAKVWNNYKGNPSWLRPVDLANTSLLLDIVIATYAIRPGDEIAGYGTVGPESYPALKDFDTRVVVKQWVRTPRGLRVPAVPVKNKEIAYAAQM